jgi:hypothetical protein
MPDRLTTDRLDALLAGVRPAADERDHPSAEILDRIMRAPAPRRRHRLSGRRRVAVIAALVALPSSGIAVAAGVVLQPPKPDATVPSAAGWTYFSDLYGDGPVLVRPKAGWLRAAERAEEAVLRHRGVAHPRCGIDGDHPLACYLPDGNLVPDQPIGAVAGQFLAPQNSDVRHLSPAQAHRWLCRHPEQRPGADYGEKPAPTEGYADCG